MELKYDINGLIPVVVQDCKTKEVLTLAYMNEEALGLTLAEKRTVFYSRSRKCLWKKGETSGNIQRVVSIKSDCDGDALVVEVDKAGPACHTGEESCFHNQIYLDENASDFCLDALYNLLVGRKATPKEGSYTSYLFAKGQDKILKKVGEECTEVIIAGTKRDREETIFELADLVYHCLVLMVEGNITLDDVRNELAKRHIVDHKVKQETMK